MFWCYGKKKDSNAVPIEYRPVSLPLDHHARPLKEVILLEITTSWKFNISTDHNLNLIDYYYLTKKLTQNRVIGFYIIMLFLFSFYYSYFIVFYPFILTSLIFICL